VKQLYCTSGDQGTNGATSSAAGTRVRAASAGLAPERVQAVLRYAAYASPPRGPAAVAEPPARLALLQAPEAGCFLCHSTCLGIDPATGKNGKFFSHVLLDVPATLDAQHAIQSWGSPLWQRADQGGVELPEALFLPVSSALDDDELARFLDRPAHRELLQFLLAALLTTPAQTRIFLAAPAEDVARCVYGVTRALPPSLLEGFTFSTCEADPLSCPARVVGTCWEEAADLDLPERCYAGQGVAYNRYTGRKSELPAEPPFVLFAVEALSERRTSGLDEFHASWQRLGVKEPALFELVYRMARGGGTLTKEESQQALHHPTLCSWVAARPDALGQFLEWALEDQAYATATFSRAVAALRQKPDVLTRLAQSVQERGVAALRAGDLVRTRNALEALMPMVAPARSAAVWEDLLGSIPDPEALPWEMRCYLLPRLARLRPLTPDTGLRPWLDVRTERLAALLALDLPEAWRLAACLACLRHEGEPSRELARTLAAHPQLVLGVLQRLTDPEAEARAVALFQAVLAEAPAHPWGDDLVRHGRSLPGLLLDRCLFVALEGGHTAAADLLAAGHGPALLELLRGKPTLDRVAAQLLSRPADNLRTDGGRGEFLLALAGVEGLRPEVRSRLEACLGFRAFLERPALDPPTLGRVAAALRHEPPLVAPEVSGRVVSVIADELARRAGEQVQADLETVLVALGPGWLGGPSALYRALLRDRQGRRAFWKQPDLVHAFLAVALGARQSPELAGLLDNLDAEAFGLAQQAARRRGSRLLAAIDRRTAAWPPGARSQWGFLARAVQPRRARQLLRESALFLAGLLVGGVGVLGLRLFGVM
jgi:hypothetical protein